MHKARVILNACLLMLVTGAGCAGPKVTARMYELRDDGDLKFVQTVLDVEQRQHGVQSDLKVSDNDDVATVTTTARIHQQLRRSLNVRVSNQWPYNWRTDDF